MSSTYSAYKTSGKPLSVEAQYHQKLKQGVFKSPSGTIVGVNSNASDTAALLAASSDLTVKPSYERSVAPEAQTAALAARRDSKSNTLASTTSSDIPSTTIRVGIPSLNSNSIYTAAHKNSASSMKLRTDPGKDNRSGLQSKQAPGGSLNIDKINKLATKNSSKSLTSRFNPDLDYRSGLKKQKPTEFLDQEEEDLAASGAAASLKHGGPDFYSNQTRSNTFKAGDIVNSTLLAAANTKANEKLNSLKSTTPKSLKEQAQLYANALAIAQKNSDERLKTHQSGLINLGGGLTITQAELDKLASSYVHPILDDIEGKAESKRRVDLEKKQKQLELQQLHEKAKQEEQEAKLKEKQDIEAAKQKRLTDNEQKKKDEDDKFTEHQKVRNEEVDQKNQELKDLEAKHNEEKDALLKEKEENQKQIDEEEAEKIAERKKELDDLQAEKDEELKPTLDELSEENAKLKEVTDARDELANEVKASEDTNKEYEDKLTGLRSKLEETKGDIEKYTADLEESKTKHESTDKELADLQIKHDNEKSNAELESKDLDSKLEDLSKQKEDHTKSKADKKKQILSGLDDKVKDEHKINQELPEHLRSDVDDKKIKDTSSIFTIEKSEVAKKPLHEVAEKETEKPKPKKADLASPTPVKKQVESSKPKATTATAASGSTKRPVTPSAAQSPTKKKSFGKRLSSFFKSSSSQPSQATTKPKTAPAAKTTTATKPKETIANKSSTAKTPEKPTKQTSTTTAKQPAAKDAEKEAKKVKKADGADYDIDDEISLNKKNQGGVFKEEI
ncbi:unnamed protein product [Candida verbasci]|uniref:Eisosome protein 1 n=1 Tax=Candida verbasci TaxID=1227364 RepID=A0A9W4TVI9_9ASCO|nr:unnamed protein product [Candida verbasci]